MLRWLTAPVASTQPRWMNIIAGLAVIAVNLNLLIWIAAHLL